MIRKVQFESQERRINQVLAALKENGINSIEEANEICEKAGIDPYQMCVYDPYDSLCTLFNIIDSVKNMPVIDGILHDKNKKANALGRSATIYGHGAYTKNIVVIYDSNGNIKHTSIQSEKKGEQIMSKFFERYHRDPFWEEPPR